MKQTAVDLFDFQLKTTYGLASQPLQVGMQVQQFLRVADVFSEAANLSSFPVEMNGSAVFGEENETLSIIESSAVSLVSAIPATVFLAVQTSSFDKTVWMPLNTTLGPPYCEVAKNIGPTIWSHTDPPKFSLEECGKQCNDRKACKSFNTCNGNSQCFLKPTEFASGAPTVTNKTCCTTYYQGKCTDGWNLQAWTPLQEPLQISHGNQTTNYTILSQNISALQVFDLSIYGGGGCKGVAIAIKGLPEPPTTSWLPTIAATLIAAGSVAAFFILCFCRKALMARRKRALDEARATLEEALWRKDDPTGADAAKAQLRRWGVLSTEVEELEREIARAVSLESGVSVAYLLSDEFTALARSRTGQQDPTFEELGRACWISTADPLAAELPCPRDGQRGCALIDWLPARCRGRQTHFLSWSWQYRISEVQGALQTWIASSEQRPDETFLWMCFFMNNQHRMLGSARPSVDSAALCETFESNLRRINRLVAVLDHWREPLYLTRIWTIFEQFCAMQMNPPVSVEMILPPAAEGELIAEVRRGDAGLAHLTASLSRVDAEQARATIRADEEAVKRLIRTKSGFGEVNQAVRRALVAWVVSRFKEYMLNLVVDVSSPSQPSILQRRGASTMSASAVLSASIGS